MTKKSLLDIFADKGIPEQVQSDNGPPYQSLGMKNFAKELGFHYHHVTPEWPRANGGVEQLNEILLKAIRTGHTEGKQLRKAVTDFLAVYQATPHTGTGKSPFFALYGREMKTKFPMIPQTSDHIDREDEKNYKKKIKDYADQPGLS